MMFRALLLLCALVPAAASGAALRSAPSFSLKTPAGETVNFPADARGQPTVLMFWPSWCPFSRALQPYVQDIWNDYRAAGVKLWTINIREERDPVAVLRERGLSFPLLVEGDAVANDYGLQYTPWLVVIDARNRIVYTRPPNPPSPIHTAKEVRMKLNELLGKRAIPLPTTWAKPYDVHLRDKSTLNKRLEPAPVPSAESDAWLKKYLAGIGQQEAVAGIAPRGPVGDGKTALGIARELWAARYGAEATRAQAPYRAYRKNRHWVVLGDGLAPRLGGGFVLVLEADSGRVVRIAEKAGP